MNAFENFKQNVAALCLDEGKKLGLCYFSGCLGAVNSWTKNDDKIIRSLEFKSNLPSKTDVGESYGKGEAAWLLMELFRCAYSLDNSTHKPSEDKNDIDYEAYFILLENKNNYTDKELNIYLTFPNTDKENDNFQRSITLFRIIGYILDNLEVTTEEEAFQLGIYHFNYWYSTAFTTNFESFFTSVLKCNVMPSVFADVINSIPNPEFMRSKSEIWLFSKELDNRIKDTKYELDLATMQWIWGLHNFIFYEQGKGPNILREKYKDNEGFKLMLSDIFRSINEYGKINPINSKNYKFHNLFNDDQLWEKFCGITNYKVKEDFGTHEILEFDNQGEFFSFYSYRFIHAMMLFLKRKKKFLFFSY
ncbi:MAG: hypothetical protein RJA76_273 [Bacteroidota bacterium]|jgi:hypothetical protein